MKPDIGSTSAPASPACRTALAASRRSLRRLGELCTLRALHDVGRDYYNVSVATDNGLDHVPRVADWIRKLAKGAPIVLNVAGNSEHTSPGIEIVAEVFLGVVFADLKGSAA